MRKILSMVLIPALVISLTGCSERGLNININDSRSESSVSKDSTPPEISERDITFYLCKEDDTRTMPLYFMGDSDVPYISLKDWAELYPYLLKTYVNKGKAELAYELSYSKDGDVSELTRVDGSPYTMTVDCAADTITFLDYDAFIRLSDDRVLLDVLEVDSPQSDDEKALFRRTEGSYERYGDELILNAGDYGIDLVAAGDECYVPIQTLSDFLLSICYVNFFYDGESACYVQYGELEDDETGELTAMGEIVYSAEPHELSEDMSRFSYNELCLAFDNLYGLKDVHGIERFDDLALETGLKEKLMSTDTNEADRALFTIISLHLDDLHSTYRIPSPLSSDGLMDALADEVGRGRSENAFIDEFKKFHFARADKYPDGVPSYEEVDDTAFITFDGFSSIPDGMDYYETVPDKDSTDTIGIIIYAYSQIMRKDSPIENVVLDLSRNTGGDSNAAVFVLSAFLGDGYSSERNTMTGALATGVYNVDLNLDGKFDENDLGLKDKNLFCLTSPVSFSCGNLVPNVFKNSHDVVLLGQKSGGGSCVVLPMTTAGGTYFQMSGPYRLAFINNGSFYDIDRGVDPDCFIANPELFYDREYISKYVNEIMGN